MICARSKNEWERCHMYMDSSNSKGSKFVLQGGKKNPLGAVCCFCSRYIIQHPISNILKWWHLWLLSAQRRFIKLGCSLEAIPHKIRFTSERLQLNSAALYGAILFIWIFFLIYCFVLYPEIRPSFVLLWGWRRHQNKPRGGSLKRTLPAELSNSTNHVSPHSLSMDLPLGQALLALGQCRYYRACNKALSLQLTCEERFINRASVAHLSHDISFFHSWDHFQTHSLLTS